MQSEYTHTYAPAQGVMHTLVFRMDGRVCARIRLFSAMTGSVALSLFAPK